MPLVRAVRLWNQWLGTILHGMGIPRTEWEGTAGGFGALWVPDASVADYAEAIAAASDPLPLFTG